MEKKQLLPEKLRNAKKGAVYPNLPSLKSQPIPRAAARCDPALSPHTEPESSSPVGAGGSYSLVMCTKKVGLGAPPGTVLPPEIHYGGLACLQASLDPK